jgi:hypothetical protein
MIKYIQKEIQSNRILLHTTYTGTKNAIPFKVINSNLQRNHRVIVKFTVRKFRLYYLYIYIKSEISQVGIGNSGNSFSRSPRNLGFIENNLSNIVSEYNIDKSLNLTKRSSPTTKFN